MIRLKLTDEELHYKDIFPIYREYVKHQYDLINHRTTWYIGIQALLFGVFGFTIQKKIEVAANHVERIESCGLRDVCKYIGYFDLAIISYGVIAVLISGLFYFLIRAASEPVFGLAHMWATQVWNILQDQAEKEGPECAQLMPLLTGGFSQNHALHGIRLTKAVPFVFGAVWILILYFIEIKPFLLGQSFIQYVY